MIREGATVRRLLPWIIAAALLLAVAFFLGAPRLARIGGLGAGSYRHARQWREQLLACQSLDEVRQHFSCFTIQETSGGGVRKVQESETVKGRPWALLKT